MKVPVCNNGAGLRDFWVDYGESLQSCNLTEYPVCCDEMIDQPLIPQFQRYGQLQRVKSAKAQIERVTLHQRLGH